MSLTLLSVSQIDWFVSANLEWLKGRWCDLSSEITPVIGSALQRQWRAEGQQLGDLIKFQSDIDQASCKRVNPAASLFSIPGGTQLKEALGEEMRASGNLDSSVALAVHRPARF